MSTLNETSSVHRDSDEILSLSDTHVRNENDVNRIPTHMSHTHDTPMTRWDSSAEVPDSIYDRFSPSRKIIMVVILSWCAFLAPISSTTVLSATPEIASQYNTTGTIIDISSALYMVGMAVSPMVWGPMSQVYGRRSICLITLVLFIACSIGTALAPNLAAFFVFRILTAFQGTSFLIVGSSAIGDIYRPTERATAIGWFFSGTLIGPALGPFLGGIIVTYASWRNVFWLQTAVSGPPLVAAFFLLSETIHHRKADDLVGLPMKRKLLTLAHMISPIRVIVLYKYMNLVCVSAASSALVFSMYSLLTPIRYVLNPRFHLETPMESGLFYLAPGCGYLTGTFFGGRFADRTVRKWIERRGGERWPEDRLRSALPFLGLVIPACILLYGWSVEKRIGGVALPVLCMFIQGVAQLFCFPSLNTYCLDVMQSRSGEVIAGNYMTRYIFGALGCALVLPAIDCFGVGWFSTISAGFLVVSAVLLQLTIVFGKSWREAVDKRRYSKEDNKSNKQPTESNLKQDDDHLRIGHGACDEKKVGVESGLSSQITGLGGGERNELV